MKLLVLAPCERLIIERGANIVSLISIMEEITPTPLPGGETLTKVPEDAVVPQAWYVLTMWGREDTDPPVPEFQVRLEIVNPRGGSVWLVLSAMVEAKKNRHRHIFKIGGFPVGIPGTYWIRVSKRPTEAAEFEEAGSYPILVKSPATEEVAR